MMLVLLPGLSVRLVVRRLVPSSPPVHRPRCLLGNPLRSRVDFVPSVLFPFSDPPQRLATGVLAQLLNGKARRRGRIRYRQ